MSTPPFFTTCRTESRARCRYSQAGPWIGGSSSAGAHAPETPQRVLERALLGGDLRAGVEVLQRAAAADAEMRAARIDARRVRFQHRVGAREVERRLAS